MKPDNTTPSPLSFRLNQWVTLRIQLLWAYEKTMDFESATIGRGDYSFQSALLVYKGWALAGPSEEKAKKARAGQWLLLGQGKRWQRFSKDCHLFSIGYRFQFPTGEPVFEKGLPLVVNAAAHPDFERATLKLMQAMKKHIGLGYYLGQREVGMRDYLFSQNAFRLFLIELADVLTEKGIASDNLHEPSGYVLRALDAIENAASGAHLKTLVLARQIGISQTHLDRLMVQETGHTVHQQIERRRRQLAKEALRGQSGSLKAIAYELGFCSPAHFTSWFRKHEAMTPLQFRRKNQW